MWQIPEGGVPAQWMPVRICGTRRVSVSLPSSNQLTWAPSRVNSRSVSSCGTLRRIGMKYRTSSVSRSSHSSYRRSSSSSASRYRKSSTSCRTSSRSMSLTASSLERVPAGRLHELPPAPVVAALVVLAGVGDGHVGDGARQRQAVVLERARGAPQAHLVVIRMLPRDRPAAGLVGVVPVLHVVLLGESRRPGISDVVMAQEVLHL